MSGSAYGRALQLGISLALQPNCGFIAGNILDFNRCKISTSLPKAFFAVPGYPYTSWWCLDERDRMHARSDTCNEE